MILSNQEIYNNAINLSNFHIEGKLPVKINFFLQKNIKLIQESALEIDNMRMDIAANYGVLNSDNNTYEVPAEKMSEAQKELSDLFGLKQDLNIHVFKLNDFDNIDLTYDQLANIMFMIEE